MINGIFVNYCMNGYSMMDDKQPSKYGIYWKIIPVDFVVQYKSNSWKLTEAPTCLWWRANYTSIGHGGRTHPLDDNGYALYELGELPGIRPGIFHWFEEHLQETIVFPKKNMEFSWKKSPEWLARAYQCGWSYHHADRLSHIFPGRIHQITIVLSLYANLSGCCCFSADMLDPNPKLIEPVFIIPHISPYFPNIY